MKTTIVVAFDEERGIGKGGDIPWFIKGEMAWLAGFTKARTNESSNLNALVMGRTTWESLPKRPLPEREHLVISRTMDESEPGCRVYRDLDSALQYLNDKGGVENAFIFGGSQIYQASLSSDLVDRVVTTEVPGKHDCDTFFPELSNAFELKNEEETLYGDVKVVRKYWEK